MKKYSSYILLIIVVLLTGYIVYKLNNTVLSESTKQGFVYTDKVFADYKGTKIVESKFIKKQQKQKLELDSLKAVIQVTESSLKAPLTELQKVKVQTRRNEYIRLIESYESENESESSQAKQALWVQINQYIKKYGIDNNYMFIHGANGTGSLMYADTLYNVTEPIIEYINNEFEGK